MKKALLIVFTLTTVLWLLNSALAAPKDTIVIAQGVDPTTLDPHNQFDRPTRNVMLNIYETLLIRSPDMELQPLLATSWKLVNDRTWEFKLQKGVKFQNGEDFNATAVKFSLEALPTPRRN